ncbi:MAG: M3 family metallopeptidase [Agrococcus casei]|uniref:Dipeptidyl carboxypeptidase Dcp n=1 Tax=Agrococcus casei LMG 22410 TaxID=1255656 RepID=A0A1R4G6L3_9MICO|nr:M3 family metallopeptidase [Agrococcus casei]SJM63707.1 Dipeptidyl carboxypeptidase Dcp [Agrococcus casei LMG 22410]
MTNPFFEASTLPYQLPPFDQIRDEHFAPAFDAGFKQHLSEIDEIVAQTDEPTFDNTMVPLESSGAILELVAHVFFSMTSTDSSPALEELDEQYAPKLAAHSDAISLNPALYARIKTLHDSPDAAWTDEQRYLVERRYQEMTLGGAGLDDTKTDRLKQINQRLASLTTLFEKNLQAETNDLAVVIDDVAELDGLAEGEIASAAAAAADRGLEGKWLITLPLFSGHPLLASLTNRDVRERVMRASLSRASRGNEHDNSGVVLEITRLRAERAGLLGFSSHAEYITADETAKSPENVAAMLDKLAPAARRNADAEADALRTEIEAAGGSHELASWDWAFYTERVRAKKYDVDTAALRPYFEADRVLHDGVFFAANLVYGLTFTERTDLVGYHPDNRIFEVFNQDGSALGLFLLDLYTRDSKRGGAWMNPLISQNTLLDQPTVVMNNLNVPKPPQGKPTLLTFDETSTLFHEFGHALHGLLAKVTYPSFSGTNVFRDFVEFPSQVNELWMLWPEVVENYAKHFETGEQLPREIIERIEATGSFDQGKGTSEYLAAALLDQAWHRITADDEITDVAEFERQALEAAGLLNPVVPTRYSTTYFQHVFAGGYSAGYYSYIWSEVMDADTVEYFKSSGDVRAIGEAFRQKVLGVGGSKDPIKAFEEFRGRPADIAPLLERRGLAG